MATKLSKFVGQFFATTVGTTQTISNPGFQPKVVLFFASGTIVSGTLTNSTEAGRSVGFSDGTNHRLVAWAGDGGVSTTAVQTTTSNANCIVCPLTGTTNSPTATIAMTSTGFTVTWSSTPASAYVINYVALGGTDLANVAIGTGTMPTTPIANSVTGLGFTPNFVMLISGSQTGNASIVANAKMSYGAAKGASRFAEALTVQNGQTTTANVKGLSVNSTTSCLMGINTNAATIEFKADFTSFDSNTGFTITFSTAPASAYQYYYLAIGGTSLNWDIATALKPSTAIAQSETGMSFQPEVGIWSNSSVATLDTVFGNAILYAGFSDGTNSEVLAASHSNAIPTVAGTKSAIAAAANGIPANTAGVANFTSFNPDGWTITWASATAANFINSIMLAGTPFFDAGTVVAESLQGGATGGGLVEIVTVNGV